MKKTTGLLFSLCALLCGLFAGAVAQTKPNWSQFDTTGTRQPIVVDCKQRWHIYYSNHVRADTFLLDTDTGQCFVGVADKSGNTVWQEVEKTYFSR